MTIINDIENQIETCFKPENKKSNTFFCNDMTAAIVILAISYVLLLVVYVITAYHMMYG